jgi:hypothetical protein
VKSNIFHLLTPQPSLSVLQVLGMSATSFVCWLVGYAAADVQLLTQTTEG